MRILVLLLLCSFCSFTLVAQTTSGQIATTSSSTTSTSTSQPLTNTDVEQKVSDLQKTINELKSRLEQSGDNGFPFGKFTFSKKVKVFKLTPTKEAVKFLPASMSKEDKETIVSLIQKGYKSTSFQSSQDTSKEVRFSRKKLGLFLFRYKPFVPKKIWKLTITPPDSKTPIVTKIFKDDLFDVEENSEEKTVEHVLLSIHSGTISRIQVDAGGSTYSNQNAPILLRSLQSRYNDRLFNSQETEYVRFGTKEGIVKSYFPYTAKPYLIDDQEHHFIPSSTSKEDTLLLSLKTDSDNYVKIRFFTDLLGLANQRNPVTQIEGTVRIVLNSVPIFNTRKSIFQHIQLRVGSSYFDSRQDTLRLNGIDTARTELFRKANWYGNLKLAVLSHRGNVDADLLVGLEGRLVKHVYTDQLNDQTIFVGGPFSEAAFRYTLGPNASLNLLAGTLLSRTNRKPDIPNNNKTYALAYVSAEADYAPFNSQNSRIFFRLNHYWNWTIAEPTITQAQVGYSGTLSGILGGKAK